MGSFQIIRVVSRDIVRDFFNSIRNLFGLRLLNWEKRINETISKMTFEMHLKYKIKWYRLIVNPLVDGSAMIILYGEGKLRKNGEDNE